MFVLLWLNWALMLAFSIIDMHFFTASIVGMYYVHAECIIETLYILQ